MERCSVRLARRARSAGFDARLVLYDSPYGRAPDEYDVGDIPVEFVPRSHGFDYSLCLRLRRLFGEWDVGVVHARNQIAAFYSALALAIDNRGKLPLVITFDTFPAAASVKGRLASRWAGRRARRVTAVSDELAKRLTASGWLAACETVWNTVDVQSFSPNGPLGGWRSRLGIKPNAVVVAQLARANPNKRQVDLLAAVRLLRGQYPDLTLVLAGDGPDWPMLQSMCRGEATVHLIRHVADVPAFLREIDIAVLCSDHEVHRVRCSKRWHAGAR
jgi:glycosyltransferase involved in cell wall biosynthesis